MPYLSNIGTACSITRSPLASIKLGIILEAYLVPNWVHYLVGKLNECGAIDLVLVVLNSDAKAVVRSNSDPILFRLWTAFDRWSRRHKADALQLQDWRVLLKDCSIPVIELQTGDLNHSSEIDTALIKAANCDLLLYLGNGTPEDEILTCAHLGMWSVQQGSLCGAAGVPGQFWDMYEGNRITRHGPLVIEQKQNRTRTVYRSSIVTNFLSLTLNQNTASWEIAEALVRRLSDTEVLRTGMQVCSDTGVYPPTSLSFDNAHMAGFLVQWAIRTMRHEVRKRLFREQWSMVLQPNVDTSKVDFEHNIKSVRPPKDRFYADPFVIKKNGRNYLFFEDYRFSSQKGMISCCEVDAEGNCSEPCVVLERKYHLSYPFLFTWREELYMIPETRDNGTIEMYRTTKFPYTWVLEDVLMSDVAATDSTLLHYQDKWWLFTAGMSEHASPNDTLWLFFAESPMGPWTAHPKNPIVSDPSHARPAGSLFFNNGELIRPGQDCSKGYGYAVHLHRVSVLSETDYQESLLLSVSPDQIIGSRGIHTFNQNAELRVIDSKFLTSRFNFTFRSHVFKGSEVKYDDLFTREPAKNSR